MGTGTKCYCVRTKDRRLILNIGEKPRKIKKGVSGWRFLTNKTVELPMKWFPQIRYESGAFEMKLLAIDIDVGKTKEQN